MELFKQLARATQDGLDVAADGSLALDNLVPTYLAHRRVTRHLAARQTSGGGEPKLSNKRGGDNNPEVDRLREKVRKLEQQAASSGKGGNRKGRQGASEQEEGQRRRRQT